MTRARKKKKKPKKKKRAGASSPASEIGRIAETHAAPPVSEIDGVADTHAPPPEAGSKIGRIADRHLAFWGISQLLMGHPRYRNVPFANIRLIQQAIALGNYCCLTDGKAIQAAATWQAINVAALLQTYPKYKADKSAPADGIFLTSFASVDRDSFRVMISHLRASFLEQDVYWDRHKGKLGHKPKALRN